jgi:DNA-directed RNA polymerase subunit RPC12/RpoP
VRYWERRLEERRARRAVALGVACSVCYEQPGHTCTGRRTFWPLVGHQLHTARWRAARTAQFCALCRREVHFFGINTETGTDWTVCHRCGWREILAGPRKTGSPALLGSRP